MQLYQYLNNHNLLLKVQFGFKPKSSPCVAVSRFTDRILENLDKGRPTGVVFLDLLKAFDLEDHVILLDKLSYMGIKKLELQLFRSYSTN